MKLKKLLQGSLFAAAAAICMMAGTVDANAAKLADAGISKLDIAADGTMKVTKGSGAEVMVGVASVSGKGVAKVASWDIYDGSGEQTVDLSKLSNVKDNYIAVKSNDKDEPAIIKIPAASKAIKASIDTASSNLFVSSGDKASTPAAVTTDVYEYRTAYSAWNPLFKDSKSADMSSYQKMGATVYVREKGVAQSISGDPTTGDGAVKVTYGKVEDMPVYVATAKLPGKEAKVNIPAAAKGPSVSIDYVKGTVTIPAKSEYRFITGTSVPTTAPTDNATKTVKTVSELITASGATGDNAKATLEVRTKADKKAASKWTSVNLTKQATISGITASDTPNTTTEDKDGKVGGSGIAKTGLLADVTITYDAKNNIVIKNGTTDIDYEFTCTAAKATKPAANAVIKKVAAGKTVTIKGWEDGHYVFVREAGNKKTLKMVGEFTDLGVIDYVKDKK